MDGQDLTPTALILLADNKFNILKLKGELNVTSQILALKVEIQNLNKRASKRDHNRDDYNPKNIKRKDSRDKPSCLKHDIKP